MSAVTVRELQQDVFEFAKATFGPGREDAAWKKLFEELGEVLKRPRDPDEWGDVFILLFDLATIYGVQVDEATLGKLAIIRNRVWGRTETGTFQHVPGAEKPDPRPTYTAVLTGGPNGGPAAVKMVGAEPPQIIQPEADNIGIYVLERTDRGMGGQSIHFYKYHADGVPF